jgi:tetratricopeptide (TPR) repeat protein
MGHAYARRGDMRRAAVAYEKVAWRDHSREATTRVAMALSHISDKTPAEKGKAAYWSALAAGFMGDFPAALRLGKIASANPATHRLGLQAMAEAYRGMQQKKAYIATMQKITASGSVDDLLLMARVWGDMDEHVKRTEYLRRALAKAALEQQPAIHRELAELYRRRGMRDEAERELEQALQIDPRDAQLHRQLAQIYFERRMVGDRLKWAIAACEAAIAIDPNNETDWQRLGSAYVAAGQAGKAIRYLEHAIDLEAGHGRLISNWEERMLAWEIRLPASILWGCTPNLLLTISSGKHYAPAHDASKLPPKT